MALGIDFNTANSGNGDTLYTAFTKINNMFTTTTQLSGGDLTINDVRVGRGLGNIVTNTALGTSALNSNTTGNINTAVGVGALEKNQNGNLNTAVGNYALERNISGSLNTAIGSGSLYLNQTGSYNTAIGRDALSVGTNFSNVTAIGYNAQATADNQVVIGNGAVTTTILRGAVTADKDATFNSIKIGKGIGSNNSNSTAVGIDTLISATTGGGNTALGFSALKSNADGWYNVAIGSEAMKDAIGSAVYYNVAIGSQSLKKTTNGGNTAIGVNTLLDNLSGGGNTAIGEYAIEKNIDGLYNTALGSGALYNNLSQDYNTAIGKGALSANTDWSYCTGLGYDAQVTGIGQIQLGSGTTTCYTYGALNNRSDLRDKAEVRDTVLGLDFVNSLRAVDYKWDMREDYRTEIPTQGELSDENFKILMDEWLESVKLDNLTHDGTNTRTRYHHGLIAQEVQDVIEASGVDFGGFQDHSVNGGQDVLSIGYTELIAPMIKAIQELTARINVLEGN